MECDKNLIDQINSEQIASNSCGEVEQSAKNYLGMATSMPVFSGALSYISSTYNSVKNPPSTSESSSLWNNKISQSILNASNKALDATVTAVDSYLSPEEADNTNDSHNETMSSRLSSVADKARKRIVGMVGETSDTENQHDTQVVKKDIPENNRWLFKVYKNLQEKPKNESLILTILRFSAIISVKATLTVQEAIIEPNMPLFERTFFSVVKSAKEASYKLLAPIKNSIDRATIPIKNLSKEALDASLEKSREFFDYVKGVGLQMTTNAINYAKALPNKAYKEMALRFQESSNSYRESRTTDGHVATDHKD